MTLGQINMLSKGGVSVEGKADSKPKQEMGTVTDLLRFRKMSKGA